MKIGCSCLSPTPSLALTPTRIYWHESADASFVR
jgi:hypothetical protein